MKAHTENSGIIDLPFDETGQAQTRAQSTLPRQPARRWRHLGALTGSPVVAGCTVAATFAVYVATIRQEEQKLEPIFGTPYLGYLREVPSLLPRLARLRHLSHDATPCIITNRSMARELHRCLGLVRARRHVWLPKTLYVLTSLTFSPWLSYRPGMRTIALPVLSMLLGLLQSRALLHLEILALRQQLAMVKQARRKRLRFHLGQRLFWVWLYRLWPGCLQTLQVFKPDTLVRWHHKGFRLYGTWKSRCRMGGHPPIAPEVRELIRAISRDNIGRGAPRIHGELQLLGIHVCQATVAKYMVHHPKPPS